MPEAGQIALASHLDLFQLDKCSTDTANSSSSTWATPTGMSGVSLAAGETYWIEVNVTFTSAVSTTGMSLRLTFSGTDGGSRFIGFIQTSGSTAYQRSFFTVNQDTGWASADSAGATVLTAVASGYVTADTAGTLTLQFRSEVNTSAVTLKALSHLHATKTTLV